MINNLLSSTNGKTATLWTRKLIFSMLLVAVVTFIVYSQVLHNNFINYDDISYVTSNNVVQKGITLQGIIWAFTTHHAGNWHPLTWLSHMLDVEMFGLNPAGHHFTNLILHIANALLLLTILLQLTGFLGRSLAVTLLFALHPLHVESVAWVAERKDILSAFLWLLTMWAYLHYSRRPGLMRYLLVVGLFCLGLMSKQMLVTLPVVLLLMDYWPLKRKALLTTSQEVNIQPASILKICIIEKIPLFTLSAIASVIAVYTQDSVGAVGSFDRTSVWMNAGNAFISYMEYIKKMFWPVDLAVLYPFDPTVITFVRVACSGVMLTTVTVICFQQRVRRPYLLFGWLWYLVTLLPVIGFIRIGVQAFADRYTYIPLIGLFVFVVWGVAEFSAFWKYGRRVAVAISAVTVIILSTLTMIQVGYWSSNIVLFKHTLDVTENNWVAHNNLGLDLERLHALPEAISHFQEAIRINPEYSEAYNNLGKLHFASGNMTEAIAALRAAVSINPEFVVARTYLGYAYLAVNNEKMARAEYEQLLRLNGTVAESLHYALRQYRLNHQPEHQKGHR